MPDSAVDESATVPTEPEIRPPPPYPFHLYPGEMVQTKQEDTSGSDSENTPERITVIDVDPDIQLLPPPAKGILKTGKTYKEKRNIEFDPLALLLDAALEGELDLVKKSAQKVSIAICKNIDWKRLI